MSSIAYWKNEAKKVASTDELFNTTSAINRSEQNFSSIDEFKDYISESTEIEFGGNEQGKEYSAWFKFNLVYVGGIIIYVRQRIEPSYELLDVTSSDWGVTLTFSWEQTNYDQSTNGGQTVINIYGKLKYNLFVEGVGTVFTELKTFQVVVNNANGKEISGKIVN